LLFLLSLQTDYLKTFFSFPLQKNYFRSQIQVAYNVNSKGFVTKPFSRYINSRNHTVSLIQPRK
jgi:hypothetical protein